MNSAQWEACLRVMEESVFPELLSVAVATVRQHTTMDIVFLMALSTVLRSSGELPAIAVALGTIKSEVHSVQCEVFVEVASHLPSTLGVATCALIAEFTFVNVFVTSETLAADGLVSHDRDGGLIFNNRLTCDRFVTLAALHIHVLVLKLIRALLIVIESDGFPLILVVALKAVSIQLPFVNIAVAVQALVLFEFRENVLVLGMLGSSVKSLGCRSMTFFAIDLRVGTIERIPSFRVIKWKPLFPVRCLVTLNTRSGAVGVRVFRAELPFVWSCMTLGTELLVVGLELVDFATIFFVTVQALHFRVCAIQWESRLGVIKNLSILLCVPALGVVTLGTALCEKFR